MMMPDTNAPSSPDLAEFVRRYGMQALPLHRILDGAQDAVEAWVDEGLPPCPPEWPDRRKAAYMRLTAALCEMELGIEDWRGAA